MNRQRGARPTDRPEILVLARIYAPTLDALEREYTVHKLWLAADGDALLRDVGPRVRAVVTTSLAGFARERFELLPQLELIASSGVSTNTIDLVGAKARGIAVTNTPDAIAGSVADVALALILAVMRRIVETDRFVRAGRWREALPPLGRELANKTCGILGLGHIGTAVARRAQAFGMAVAYCGPRDKKHVLFAYHADVAELARACDVLVVTCASTPYTRNLVDARVLDALGSDGFLVNVARGAIVDRDALVSALAQRRIAGAGLDVYWDEPNVPGELMELDNVVLLPHIGSSTFEVRERRSAALLTNIKAHFSGEPLPNLVLSA